MKKKVKIEEGKAKVELYSEPSTYIGSTIIVNSNSSLNKILSFNHSTEGTLLEEYEDC